MTDKPLMSVIVPVHNSRGAIASCLRAVHEQRSLDSSKPEIIVVDDGSRDGSAAEAKGLCDRLIKLDKNSGAAVARNRGAAEASADILVFVDSDVILLPDALGKIRELFVRRPDTDAAVGRYTEMPAGGGLVNAYHNSFTRFHHDLSPEEIDWFWGALGAVKRDAFFEAGGFDERYRGASAEDMELGLALFRAGRKIRYCPEAEGAHAHEFTIWSMLANDYKKAVLGAKLLLRGGLPSRAPGFASAANVSTPPLLVLGLALMLFGIREAGAPFILAGILGLASIFVLNRGFYGCLRRRLRRCFLAGVLLHWLQMFAIIAGGLAGTAGAALGRTPYGRPGWI